MIELAELTVADLPLDEIPELEQLNDRQRNFVVFFVANGGNGAAAARSAGYADITANRCGGRMAKQFRKAILACRDWYFSQLIISKNEGLAILSDLSRGNLGDVLDDDGRIDGKKIKKAGRVVDSYQVDVTESEDGVTVKRKVKIRDPRAAIDSVAKILGWGKEAVDIEAGNVHFTLNLGGAAQ